MKNAKKLDLDMVRTKIIELFLRHDPYKLNYSKVSRYVRVPRSTLYYYFGSSFSALLDDSFKFGLSKLTQIDTLEDFKKFDSWEEFQLARLKHAFSLIKKYPWAPLLFMRFRLDPGALGESIRLSEKKFLRSHLKAWQHFHKKESTPRNEHLVASLKMGVLWAVGNSVPPFTEETSLSGKEDLIIKHLLNLQKEIHSIP